MDCRCVEWSLHNPEYGEYDFTGMANLVNFIELAAKQGLYVILRVGPFIGAERSMGGFPYWLLDKYPDIQLRTQHPSTKLSKTLEQNSTENIFQVIIRK